MAWRVCLFVLSGLALGAGCGGSEGAPSSGEPLASTTEPGDEAGSTRASREAAERSGAGAEGVAVGEPPATLAPRALLVLRRVSVASAEDGRGETVTATSPLAFDLDASRFPPRALDPVLRVGDLSFHHYQHPEPGVLRFVAADASALPAGAVVRVGYAGEDEALDVVVMPALDLAEVR